MTISINGRKLLIVGGNSGIARQLAEDAAAKGATVVLAGRRPLDAPGFTTAQVDLGDEDSIRALATEVGELDYLVSLAADHPFLTGTTLHIDGGGRVA